MNHQILAVIITYNRKDKLEKSIQAVLGQEKAECDLLVVDNGSTDGTREIMETKYALTGISYVRFEENRGCAGGMNAGFREAVLRGYEYIWAMDDDFYPDKDALFELMNADELLQHDWGCLSGTAYYPDGSICKANRQKKGIFRFVKDSEYESGEPIPIMMASLASMFLKTEAVKKVGLPITEYFIYSEDYEFCCRIRKQFKLYAIPKSKGIHDMEQNMKVDIVRDSSDRQYRYKLLYRNDMNCYRKLGMKGRLYLFLKWNYTFVHILLHEKKKKGEKIQVLCDGFREGMKFHPEIEFV